jgi:hypothetical protein
MSLASVEPRRQGIWGYEELGRIKDAILVMIPVIQTFETTNIAAQEK